MIPAGLAGRLDDLSRSLTSGIIAIDGPSGAGKSTVADELVRRLRDRRVGVQLIRTDDFATWEDPVAWWPELETDVVRSFLRRHDYRYHPRVWRDGVPHRGSLVWLRWEPLLIIEGVSSARRRIASQLTHALWLDGGTAEERLARTVARDGEAARPQLVHWQGFERGWFAVDDTRSRCRVLDD